MQGDKAVLSTEIEMDPSELEALSLTGIDFCFRISSA